jgi:hypothetical protein
MAGVLFPQLCYPKDTGFEARLASPKLIELTPGKIVSASVIIANRTRRDEECLDQLILPEGWRKITPQEMPFTLPAGAQQIRLIAIAVPATSPAGRFEVGYSFRSEGDYALTDSATFTVGVLSVSKLELIVDEKPTVAVAGDDIEAKLRLTNRGNSPAQVALTVKSTPEASATTEVPAVTIAPGSSRAFRVHAKTDATLNKRISQVITVKATAESATNGSPVQVAQTILVEVLPKVSGDSDPYVRLPMLFRVTGVAETGKDPGAQVELSGAGNLDEAGKDKVDFLFRGPDLQPSSSAFGLRDEYRVSIFDPLFDLHLGDRSYALSPLTERNAYGRGAEFDLHPGPTRLGFYYMESRWTEENYNEIGSYVSQEINDHLSIKGNFLEKNGHSFFLTNGVPANIYSIEPHLRFGKEADLALEYGISDSNRGFGSNTDAYRADLRGQLFDDVSYALERVHADPNFFGYYSDSDATYGSLAFPIYEKLRGTVSVNQYDNNLKLDPQRGSVANREITYRPGILYPLPFKTDLTLEYQDIRRQDVLLPAAYDFHERSMRLGLGHCFGKVGLQTFVEQGVQHDYLLKQQPWVERYSLYAYYRPTPRQTYSLFTTFGSGRFTSASDWQQTYGGSVQWKIKENTAVNVQYARNEYNSLLNQQQDTALATVSHTFANHHNIALAGRWIQTSATKDSEMSVMITYSIPLSVPIGKKTSVGVIRGKVYDGEKGRSFPLARVILRANELTAVTDKSGQFSFPSLKPGTYVLQIDLASIGLERVTSEIFPAKVEVKKGSSITIDIGVVRSSTVKVKLARMAMPNSKVQVPAQAPARSPTGASTNPATPHLLEVGGLEGGLVELSDGREVLRQVTDRLGVATFERVRPGSWTLIVYENNLPGLHYIETPKTKLELSSNDRKEIGVRILPRHRQIEMIDQGTVK